MAAPEGRLVRVAPVACFILAFASALTAVGALGLALRPGFGFGSDPYPYILATPFALLSLLAVVAGRSCARQLDGGQGKAGLGVARALVAAGFIPLLVSLPPAIGLGYLASNGAGDMAALMLTVAQVGIPLTLLAWIVAMVMVVIARAPGQPAQQIS